MSDDLLARAARSLAQSGIEGARRDARLLWRYANGIAASALVAREDARVRALFDALVTRRCAREPLAYIVGEKEFWSLPLVVGPGALVPRPETETLVEELSKAHVARDAPHAILDLGTGTACLLVAALKEFPAAQGVGVDQSAQALEWAKRNVERHSLAGRVTLVQANWLEGSPQQFDVILCNPPYIATEAISQLAPEILLHEPPEALDGGQDGLDAYRALAPRISRLLRLRGKAFLEIGAGQAESVQAIMRDCRLKVVAIAPDLAGISRCIVLERDNQDG